MHQFGNCGYHCEVRSDDRRRSQRVRHAALEDQVYVHQSVADDGVSEGERQQSQRKYRHLHGRRRHRAEQIGNDVKQREGRNRHHSAARNPLQLLAQDGRGCVPVVAPQDHGGGDEEDRQVSPVHPVEIPQQPRTRLQKLQRRNLNAEQNHSRQIQQGNRPAVLTDEGAPLREGQHEVQE